MASQSRWLSSALLTAALCALGPTLGNCQLIFNVSIGTGSESGLVFASNSNCSGCPGTRGTLCYLDETRVGDAVCTVVKGLRATRGVARIFNDATSQPVVAAINGCPDFKPDQSSGWNLNNDCRVITGANIPSVCHSRRLAVTCDPPIELRRGPSEFEGLVLTGLTGDLGTVCASGVGVSEAAAICRSLGSPFPERGIPLIGSRYRPQMNISAENATTVESLQCGPGVSLAGCTWRPAASPECFRENNRLAVSCPTGVVTPKPLPSPTLVCYRQQASVCFKRAAVSNDSYLELMLNSNHPSPCRFEFQNITDSLCVLVKNYSACAEVASDQPGLTEYRLWVRFKGEFDASGNYVRPQLDFNLYCIVSRESFATGATLLPHFSMPTTVKDGHGGGESVVELYRDLVNGNFENRVSGSVEVGTFLFAAVLIKNPPVNIWLVVNSCWAIDGPRNVTLVRNRCPVPSDVALIPVNATAMAVRFQVFLMNGGISGQLSLICSTVVCRLGDPSEECSRACGGGAFARGAAVGGSSGVDRPEHHVTRPALLTVISRDGGGGGRGKSATQVTAPVAATLAVALLTSAMLSI